MLKFYVSWNVIGGIFVLKKLKNDDKLFHNGYLRLCMNSENLIVSNNVGNG